MNTKRRNGISGFTLLEILVAMAIMVILFTLSVNALLTVIDTSEDVVRVHNDELQNHAFERVFKNGFASLGRHSRLDFNYVDHSGKFDTFLALTNTPNAFDISFGQQNRVDHVCIAAEHKADGWLRIGIYYADEERYSKLKLNDFAGLNELPYLNLVDEAEMFIWNFYNPDSDEWVNEITNFTPSLVELKMKRPESTRSERYVFAIK